MNRQTILAADFDNLSKTDWVFVLTRRPVVTDVVSRIRNYFGIGRNRMRESFLNK